MWKLIQTNVVFLVLWRKEEKNEKITSRRENFIHTQSIWILAWFSINFHLTICDEAFFDVIHSMKVLRHELFILLNVLLLFFLVEIEWLKINQLFENGMNSVYFLCLFFFLIGFIDKYLSSVRLAHYFFSLCVYF